MWIVEEALIEFSVASFEFKQEGSDRKSLIDYR